MGRSKKPQKFLTPQETEAIQQRIKDLEKITSAEIKFVITRYCWIDIKKKAVKIFKKFNLYKTKDRNCVLILLVTTNQEFVVYGDRGITEKVGDNFWKDAAAIMNKKFQEDKFGEGICIAIELIGEKLIKYFPLSEDNKNEISDKVGFDA